MGPKYISEDDVLELVIEERILCALLACPWCAQLRIGGVLSARNHPTHHETVIGRQHCTAFRIWERIADDVDGERQRRFGLSGATPAGKALEEFSPTNY